LSRKSKSTLNSNKGLNFSSGDPVTVLLPSMGAKEMPDFDSIKSELEKLGAKVISVDLNKQASVRKIAWDKVDVIDLSNMRSCLTSFDKYTGILDRLYDNIDTQESNNRFISVIPEYEDLLWIASKAEYLTHLDNQDIPTIPTQVLSKLKDTQNASIIAQPDNFDEIFTQMKAFIGKSDKDKFVLKPSTSSLGRGLFFLDCDPSNNTYFLSLPTENNSTIKTEFNNFDELENFLTYYFTNTASPDHHFLFQEYVENLETSAVFVNGTPHFVERTQGAESHIAHARYGGIDTVIETPEIELVRFVQSVMESLPHRIQNSAFLRIDVMKDLKSGDYMLAEIEGAGAARLWLNEANRVEDYARMLIEEGGNNKNPAFGQKPATEQDIDNPDIDLKIELT